MYLILYLYGVGIRVGGRGNFQGHRQWIKKNGARSFFPGKHFGLYFLA